MKKTDWNSTVKALGQRLGAFKYPLLVLLLGLLLLLLPQRAAKTEEPEAAEGRQETAAALPSVTADGTEEKLEAILGEIEGAGRVRVMLSYAAGEKQIYQTDSAQEVRTEENGKETKTSVQTVLASEGGSRDTPVVVQTVYPIYQGALVVCEGAGSAEVRLDLVNAVSSLTGLGADKITVMKMKRE